MSESAIHDLGYKRYVGARMAPSRRWRVIMRHQISTGWDTFWRYKAWMIGAVIATVVAAAFIFIATDKAFRLGRGVQTTFANMALPLALDWYGKLAFIVSLRIGVTVIAGDLQSGAFTFYFARSTRPIDYLLGKLAGYGVLVGGILLVGPFLVACMRLGLAGYDSISDLAPQLWLLPETLVIGVVATVVYTAVPLGFSALIANRRYALGVWAAWYLIAGGIATAIGFAADLPLGALDIATAIKVITAKLLDSPGFGASEVLHISVTACVISLGVQVAAAIAIVLVQLNHAQRTGVGGAT
jgi:hypothetical protein